MKERTGKGMSCCLAALCLLSMLFLPFTGLSEEAKAGTEILISFTGDCTLGGEDRLQNKDYSFQGYIAREGYGYPLDRKSVV